MDFITCKWELCLGCRQCVTACAVAHSHTKTLFGALTETEKPHARINLRIDKLKSNIGNKCRNCNPAPCMEYCSNGALMRDEKSDTVVLNSSRCTGCAACITGCPFGNISLNTKGISRNFRHVAEKCDGCVQILKENGIPACVNACRSGALVYTECNKISNHGNNQPGELATVGEMAKTAPAAFSVYASLKRSMM